MDKTSYALGMSIAHNMMNSGVGQLQLDDFFAGFRDSMSGAKPAVSLEEAGDLLGKYFEGLEQRQQAEAEAAAAVYKTEGEAFLAQNARAEGVKTLPSGLQYKVISKGTGRKPGATDRVRCHYEGRLVDGTKFDSSYDRGEPAVFGLKQVIPGWTEGLQLRSEGAKYELYIPYQLGYGTQGAPGAIPPCAALVFTVELLKVL